MPTLTKLFTWQELSEHKSRDDCWVIVDGKVYDVTDYLDEHPGGDDVLIKSAGRDATDEFEDAGHSKDAIKLMKDYCIGEVDPTSPNIEELKKDVLEKQEVGFVEKLKGLISQYWAIPVAVVGVAVVGGIFYSRKK